MITSGIFIDYYLSRKFFRWYIRLLITVSLLLLLTIVISIFASLSSSDNTLNFFDYLPYYMFRDLTAAIVLMCFYFIFDAERIINRNRILYCFGGILIIAVFYFVFSIDNDIEKSIFKTYFNYSLILFISVVLLLLRHINFIHSSEKSTLKKRDYFLLVIIFFVMLVFLITFTMQDFIKKSSNKSGGLFESGLFKFDFNNFLQLKESIKLSEDRVLIMELDGGESLNDNSNGEYWNRQIYIKRFSLEEFVSPGGFRVSEKIHEDNPPPPYLSDYSWEREIKTELKSQADIVETLYLINIDPSSVLGSEMLYKIAPVTIWKDAPFKQIYKSYSRMYAGDYNDLYIDSPSQDKLFSDITDERKALLLNWGGGETGKKVKELAEKITTGYEDQFIKTVIIQEYLRDNYYYSLKPGLSGTTSPIEYFLFESKKGYCSYFAFAMTLMLRSVGIASRVAVGFAPDMDNKTLNFYDVRVMDGHAWVEVYFDDYGWVIFDPTSSNILPEDEFSLPSNKKMERDNLVEKIIENKDKMKVITKKSGLVENAVTNLKSLINRSFRLLGFMILLSFFVISVILLFIKKNGNYIKYIFSDDCRVKCIALWKYILTDLLSKGCGIKPRESIEEFALRVFEQENIDIREITLLYQKAVFSDLEIDKAELGQLFISYRNNTKILPFKKRFLSKINPIVIFKRILPVVLLFLLPYNIFPETIKDLDGYITEAKSAIENSYFDKALKILNSAEKHFPDSYIPNDEKGKMYFDNELYNAAVKEFLKAKNKNHKTEELFANIATCYSKLGNDLQALKVYEEALLSVPESVSIIDSLGWLYYKTHNYRKGIEIIEPKISKYNDSPEILMTLGTLYSSIWDYEKAKEFYLLSIERSYKQKYNDFRSIAYYNLALLEEANQYYSNAYNYSMVSAGLMERSSSHMELAYLYIRSMRLKEAYSEIKIASGLEPRTMFPESASCYLYSLAGKIDDAIALSKSLLSNTDYSWMMFFGTSIDAYKGDIYKVLCYSYDFKSNTIYYSERNSFLNIVTRPFRSFYYKVVSLYYNFRFTNIFLEIGKAKLDGGSDIEGLHQIYTAFEKTHHKKALKVLKMTKRIELPLIRTKKRIFDIQEAYLNKNIFISNNKKGENIVSASEKLDSRWELDIKSEMLSNAVKISSGRNREKYASLLFKDFPQNIPLYGIKVPVKIYNDDTIPRKVINELLSRGFYESDGATIIVTIKDAGSSMCNISFTSDKKVINQFILSYHNIDEFGCNLYENIFQINLE